MTLTSIQTADEKGVALELGIKSVGDRFTHQIFWKDASQHEALQILDAIEGDDAQEWPPSPPLQDYSIEVRETGQVLLAVGMAGKSHWSASVSSNHDACELDFDMACRIKSDVEFLGSTYRVSRSFVVSSVDSERLIVEFQDDSGTVSLELKSLIGNCEYDQASHCIRFLPDESEPNSLTHRWRYSMSIK